MPIVSKAVIAARVAAREEASRRQAGQSSTRGEQPVLTKTSDKPAPSDQQPPKARRGHAEKGPDGKWLPTGSYEEGWCKPPVAHQFKPGGKGGPGRPKGSVAHSTMLKKVLEEKRALRIDGRERVLTNREIVVRSEVNDALACKRRDSRKNVLSEMAKLYPDPPAESSAGVGASLSAADQAIIDGFLEELGLRPVLPTSPETGRAGERP